MEDQLRSLFYDTFSGLATAKELAEAAHTTQKVAKSFITKQASVQQFRKVDRGSFFIPITAKPGAYQVDLMFVKRQPVLVAIEITSRKVYTAVLKDKTGHSASTEMGEIIQKIKANNEPINTIESDSGGEFLSKFDAVLKSNGIHHVVYPKTDNKNTSLAKVERVNQTLRGYYEKLKSAVGAPSLGEAMSKVTARYNSRVHSSTDATPNSFKPEDFAPQFNKEAVRGLPARRLANKTFAIGDQVRIARNFDVFEKGSAPTFSKDLYTIYRTEKFSYYVKSSKGKLEYTKAGIEKPWRAWEMLPAKQVEYRPQAEPEPESESEEEEPEPEELLEPKPQRAPKPKARFDEEEQPVRQPRKPANPKLTKSQTEAVPEEVQGNRRVARGKLELLVKYKGYPQPSWQPIANFKFGEVYHPVIQAYLDAHPRLRV